MIPAKDEDPQGQGDGKSQNRQDHTKNTPVRSKDHRGETDDGGDGVQDRNRLFLAESHIQKSVMEMSAVCMEGTLSFHQTANESKCRIRQRDREGKDRNDERHDGIVFEHAHDGDRRQHITKKLRAGVAHEQLCRIEVIGKESQTTSDQRGKDDGNIAFGNHQSNGQHGQTADDGYPTGQPVQSVDQVDGVRASCRY